MIIFFSIYRLKNQGNRQHQHQHNHGRIELVNDPETLADDVENGLPLLFETIFSSQVYDKHLCKLI